MSDVDETLNGKSESSSETTRERRQFSSRARDARDSAMHAVFDTPGWVWAVVGGVILLMLGILAASRYRHHNDHA